MKNSNKGFTLIELLVVIAIIGILSSVVLASLTTARTKGQDAAIQSELSNMRAQAELYYSTAGSYSSSADCTGGIFIADTGLKTLITDVKTKTSPVNSVYCTASTTAWAVAAKTSGAYWCVDSTGKSASTTGNTVTGGVCGS
ncbi:MAG: type II secretion system protein [bacterium]